MREGVEQFRIDDLTTLSLHHEIMERYCKDMAAICAAHEGLKPQVGLWMRMAQQHETTAFIYRRIGERMQRRRQAMIDRIKRAVMAVGLVVMLVGFAPVLMAQEATEAAPVVIDAPAPVIVQPGLQVPEWAWFVGAVVVAGAIAGVLFVLNKAIDGLKASYPEQSKEMWEKAGEAADRGWTALSEYVKQTPFKYDDLMVNILDPLVETVIKRLGESPNTGLPAPGADRTQL